MIAGPPTNLAVAAPEAGYQVSNAANGAKFVTVDSTDFSYSKRIRQQYILPPYTNFQTITYPSTGVQVQFKIDPGNYDQLEGIFFDLNIKNNGTAAVTPAPAMFWFDVLQIGVNNAQSPILYLYPREIWEKLEWFSDEQFRVANAFNALNLSATDYISGTSLAAGASTTYTIPLLYSLFDRLNPSTLNGSLYLTFFLNSNPVNTGTDGFSLQLLSCDLRIVATTNPAAKDSILTLYKQYPAYLPFTYAVPYTTVQTLTAGQGLNIQLLSFIGNIHMMTVSILASSYSNANNGNLFFYPLSGTDSSCESGFIDVLDARLNTILGSGQIPERSARTTAMTIYGGGSLSVYQPVLFIMFANHPAASLQSGQIDGYQYMDGTYFLRLVPGSTFTSGTYTVLINAWMYASMVEDTAGILARGF